ncbi:MAG: VWA domain-containing protein [Proteobacteria bacterium]|nr:VWA domain-containing protein [Pseudomonadota bacterium]
MLDFNITRSDGNQVVEYSAPETGPLQLGNEIKPLIADFARDGTDLTLTSENGDFITIEGYFSMVPGPDLLTVGGAKLSYDVVSKLAGPGPVAQTTTAQTDAGQAIGEITDLSGTVTVQHTDGTREELVEGAAVFQGDVLETGAGASFAIVFADDTQFSMGENGRAVLDEMIYNPSGGDGTFGISLLQGVFSLVSGQIAKDDPENVSVKTPVGTIGIRGTSWSGQVKAVGEESIFTLFTGAIVVVNEGGSQEISIANQSVVVTSFSSPPSVPFILTGEQLFNIYGEALRLINPEWFDDEDNFDPDKVAPEAGQRRTDGGGADFQDFAAGAIIGGLELGELLGAGDLLDPTQFSLDDLDNLEEIVGVGVQTELNVNAIIDPESGNLDSFEVLISLNQPTGLPVTITYEIRPGTATGEGSGAPGDVDFIDGGTGTVVIEPGQTSASFSVSVVDDEVIEDLEFFIVALVGADNADINVAFSQAVVVITDDDIGIVTLGAATIDGVAIADGATVSEDAGVLSYELVLDKALAPGVTLSIDYVVGGTTTAGSDYTTAAIQTATFDGGETGLEPGATITIDIPIVDDGVFEPTESLTLNLVGASSNAVLEGDTSFTINIADNEPPLEFEEVDTASLDEVNGGGTVEGLSLGLTGGSGTYESISFDAAQPDFAGLNLTSGGVPVVLTGLGTSTVIGTAGGQPVFTVTLNADGTYDFTLQGPLDHVDSTGSPVGSLAFSLTFTALDENGSVAGNVVPIVVDDSAPLVGTATDAVLNEDDLIGGTDLTPDSLTATGTVDVDLGLDGSGTVILDISGLPDLTSRGDTVEYDLSTLADGVTQRVTATATADGGAPRPVFTLDFAPTGVGDNYAYSITLADVLDHPDAGPDAIALNFSFGVVDGDGTADSGSFTVSLVDDAPIASPDITDLVAPDLPAYNLVFALDTSGSMRESVSGGDESRIDVLKAAVSNLLTQYGQEARTFNITIIAFSTASSVVFEGASISDAQAFINSSSSLTPTGLTNYAAAVANDDGGAQGVLAGNFADPNLDGYNSVVYFVSDGEPTANQEVPTDGGNSWQDFVDANNVEVIAVGIGNNTSSEELAKVENGGEQPTIVVDPNDLSAVLEETVPIVEVDNVVTSGVADLLGADGGTLTSLIYDSVLFAIPQNGDSLIVDTELGGRISIDKDGNYIYEAPKFAVAGDIEVFEYTITDGDGDTSTALLSFNFVESAGAGLAVAAAFAPAATEITGTEFAELLEGTSDSETLLGLGGDDVLQGNGGNDTLTGGEGNDVFAFTVDDLGRSVITDFDIEADTVNLDEIFDQLGLLSSDRGEGDAWTLSEENGEAVLTVSANGGLTVAFENITNPDIQALDDLASRIVVDES